MNHDGFSHSMAHSLMMIAISLDLLLAFTHVDSPFESQTMVMMAAGGSAMLLVFVPLYLFLDSQLSRQES